jgi:hypothetical protein
VFAGASSNYVSTCFYIVQVVLSLLLLAQRRDTCGGHGDGNWCGEAEFSEPRPLIPLQPRSPSATDLSRNLLRYSFELDRHFNGRINVETSCTCFLRFQ